LADDKAELEIIEEYTIEGKKRFRIRIKGLNIVFNLSASSPHEAATKAAELAVKLGLIKK
jgi:hypothetical protein